MTLAEAARRFGVPLRTLQYAAHEEHLTARRLGPIWVVTAAAVGEWIAQGKHTPGPVVGTKQRTKQSRSAGEGVS